MGRANGTQRASAGRRWMGLVVACAAALVVVGPGLFAQQGTAALDENRSEALDTLDNYSGVWRSESRTTPAGRGFHFVYRLEWFDPARTTAEMLITQHFDDGQAVVLWKGFKGWDPGKEETYYHGFSPGGRAATGRVIVDGRTLVTEYRGWGSQGAVEIRDVFHPVENGSFLAVTLMLRDGEWVEVLRDVWRRDAAAVGFDSIAPGLAESALWVADDFGEPGHFLLTGADDWTETAVIWFDVQLLSGARPYAEVAAELAGLPRSEARRRVVATLRALSEESWAKASPALNALRGAGRVGVCEPMWIVNGAVCALDRRADPNLFADVPGVARVFRGMPDRAFPQPDARGPLWVEAVDSPPFDASAARPPWNLRALGVPELWAEGLTGHGVGIVVHDGGFQLDMPVIRPSIWRNPDEVPGNGVDDDRNGFVDDVHGFQFDAGTPAVNRPAVVRDELIHGNAVAAIAAGGATLDSGVQVGIAPEARWAPVMAVRNFHQAVQWALTEDMDVYGMSFSYPGLGETRSHFRKMLEHGALAGLFFVSGAGNFGDPSSPAYAEVPIQMRTPEDIPLAVFGVAGVDSTMTRPTFSSGGPVEWNTQDYHDGTVAKPDLTTVNADVVVPDLEGRQATEQFRGNSFAAPHLVGVIALLLEADPDVSPWELRQILIDTARDLPPTGVDDRTGAGLVDAPAALARLRARR